MCAAFGLAALMERWSGALALVISCAAISASIFCCYALAFSTGAARRAYRAGVFAYAGVRMLLSSQAR